jgi:hypothetical protein
LDSESIEAQLALAIISAECVFGQAKVRISAGYCISAANGTSNGEKGLLVAIDISTEVGEHIAQVFTGLMIRQLGEDRFTVERVNQTEPKKGAGR